ncbi:isomerase/hydrolase, partial [Pseudomonas syringae pv. tagetis]
MSYQHKYVDATNIHIPHRKLLCNRRNNAQHAKELANPLPTQPH